MPMTFFTEAEYQALELSNKILKERNDALEQLRPHWAQGYTSDSGAAQAQTAALAQVWTTLKVSNQTECMQRLEGLLLRSEELAKVRRHLEHG